MRVYTDKEQYKSTISNPVAIHLPMARLLFTIFKQASSLVSVLLKIKGQSYMIGSYLADNAQLSST